MFKSGSKDPERSAAMRGNKNAAGPRGGSATKARVGLTPKGKRLLATVPANLAVGAAAGATGNKAVKRTETTLSTLGGASYFSKLAKPGRKGKAALIGSGIGLGYSLAGQKMGEVAAKKVKQAAKKSK